MHSNAKNLQIMFNKGSKMKMDINKYGKEINKTSQRIINTLYERK